MSCQLLASYQYKQQPTLGTLIMRNVSEVLVGREINQVLKKTVVHPHPHTYPEVLSIKCCFISLFSLYQ